MKVNCLGRKSQAQLSNLPESSYNVHVMRVVLFSAFNRPQAASISKQVAGLLLDQGHQVAFSRELAAALDLGSCGVEQDVLMSGANLAISIGGDGTMLNAVRNAAPHGVPILGINAGALGFLTEFTPEEILVYLPRVLSGDYTLEERMMISAEVFRKGTLVDKFLALNDIVVRQGAKGRLINLNVDVAGHTLGRFSADGLIFSTPTGSTAYGLSAGGPIVHPDASVMVLAPICPHSLSFRPVVIPEADVIEVLCEGNQHGDEMMITADGQEPVTLYSGDRVTIIPAPERASLVKLDLFSFYDRLRDKLQWGG